MLTHQDGRCLHRARLVSVQGSRPRRIIYYLMKGVSTAITLHARFITLYIYTEKKDRQAGQQSEGCSLWQ